MPAAWIFPENSCVMTAPRVPGDVKWWRDTTPRATAGEITRRDAAAITFAGKVRTPIARQLLQRVHQTRDGAVQILVRTPQLFDFVDGVQHRGVVLAAELPTNLRQRRGG